MNEEIDLSEHVDRMLAFLDTEADLFDESDGSVPSAAWVLMAQVDAAILATYSFYRDIGVEPKAAPGKLHKFFNERKEFVRTKLDKLMPFCYPAEHERKFD